MIEFEELLRQQDIGLVSAIVQLIVIPGAAGTIVATLAFRRRMGRVTVQRTLVHDGTGRPAWKVVVRCVGNPANSCRIRVGARQLVWQGVSTDELDISPGGVGFAMLPPETDPDALVIVKTGSFPIFRRSFRSLEEVVVSH